MATKEGKIKAEILVNGEGFSSQVKSLTSSELDLKRSNNMVQTLVLLDRFQIQYNGKYVLKIIWWIHENTGAEKSLTGVIVRILHVGKGIKKFWSSFAVLVV